MKWPVPTLPTQNKIAYYCILYTHTVNEATRFLIFCDFFSLFFSIFANIYLFRGNFFYHKLKIYFLSPGELFFPKMRKIIFFWSERKKIDQWIFFLHSWNLREIYSLFKEIITRSACCFLVSSQFCQQMGLLTFLETNKFKCFKKYSNKFNFYFI